MRRLKTGIPRLHRSVTRLVAVVATYAHPDMTATVRNIYVYVVAMVMTAVRPYPLLKLRSCMTLFSSISIFHYNEKTVTTKNEIII